MKRYLFSVKFVTKNSIDFSILKKRKECMFLQNRKVIARGSDIGKPLGMAHTFHGKED
jgi:hypothetical protein